MVVNTFRVSVVQTVPIRTYRTFVWNCRSHPPYIKVFPPMFIGTCEPAGFETRAMVLLQGLLVSIPNEVE
jgi:hypothetical protein